MEAADYESRFARSAGSPIMLAGAVLMILAAAADYLLGGGDLPLSRGILMLFVLISGACILLSLISYKKEESAKLRGVFAIVPVFMCCYALVISYRDIASEPEVEVFLYEMLALAAFAAALYYAASAAFTGERPRVTLFFAASAAVLFLICIGGSVVAAFSYDIRPRDTGMLCYYTAFAVWSIGTVVSLCVKPALSAAGDAENEEQE